MKSTHAFVLFKGGQKLNRTQERRQSYYLPKPQEVKIQRRGSPVVKRARGSTRLRSLPRPRVGSVAHPRGTRLSIGETSRLNQEVDQDIHTASVMNADRTASGINLFLYAWSCKRGSTEARLGTPVPSAHNDSSLWPGLPRLSDH